MKKVRLLLLNPFNDLNSYEHRVMQEALFYKEHGCDVEVLILQRKVTGNSVYKNKIQGITVKHYLCKTPKMEKMLAENRLIQLLKPIIYLNWYMKFILWLRRELKTVGRCCILGHNIEMGAAMVLAGRKKENRRVFVMREVYEGQVTNKLNQKFRKFVSGFIQNHSDYLIHVVPYQKEITSKKNINKILYIPNYPVEKNYKNIKKTKSSKLRINYIGCVRDERSLKMLMDAAKGYEKIEIGIHGEGEAYAYLNSIKGNYDNVKVTGYYDYRTETRKLFAETDIIFCAYDISVKNWRIAYPIKLYEGIATNTPVMLCRGMAPAKFVEENNYGFVFDYTLESLRDNIERIVQNPKVIEDISKEMSLHENPYLWEKVVNKYLEVLK